MSQFFGTPRSAKGGRLVLTGLLCLILSIGSFITPFQAHAQDNTNGSRSPRLGATATTTTLTSNPNPALFNQAITLTAVVSATGVTVNAGTVTFKDGTTNLATVPVNATGTATLSTSTLALGLHTLTAVYNGNLNFLPSTSGLVTQVVVDHILTGTLTTLTSSANPSISGQSVTFTANVTSLGLVSGIVPTGTVTFLDGTTTLASLPLDNTGTATYTIANLSVGSHPVTAQYSGDANYATSNSTTLTQVVNNSGQLASTTTALTANPNPSILNQTVNLTATVSSSVGTPGGSVTFLDGTTTLGTATLDQSGTASFSTGQLSLGVHFLKAQYNGNASYAGSTSSVVIQTVVDLTLIGTATTLTSSANPQVAGQQVSFTAQVTGLSGAGLTGSVTFLDGTTTLGNAALNASGLAVYSTSSLSVGNHIITARYTGDASYAASTSAQLNQAINNVELNGVVVTITVTPNPAVAGQPVTVNVTVRAANGAPTPVPTGLVTFRDGAGNLASVTLDANGNASYTTSALTAGSHDLSVAYAGDTNYSGGTSNTVSLTVNTANLLDSVTSLTSSINPAILGQSLVLTATVSPAQGVSGQPSGQVTFKEGTTVLGTASLDNTGHASLNLSNLSLGLHLIQATYNGDNAFKSSLSNLLSQVVVNGTLLSTNTSLSSSLRVAAFGQVVTFSAQVSPTNSAVTGQVVFKDGGTVIGNANLDNQGRANLSTNTLAVGTHSITAEYSGNSGYAGSASASLSLPVKTVAECLQVTASDDSDLSCGTLREAITLGNGLIGTQAVTVTVSTNSVSLNGPLPTLTNNSTNTFSLVAGCTTANGRGVPGTSLTRANGATFAGAGLNLTNRIVVKGFAIGGFNGYAVNIAGDGNGLECNWLGTLDGTTASPNTGGVQIAGNNNRLGQADQIASGNLISGNSGWGIKLMSGTGNFSAYSWVGLQKTGTAKLKNGSGSLQAQRGVQLKLGAGNRLIA